MRVIQFVMMMVMATLPCSIMTADHCYKTGGTDVDIIVEAAWHVQTVNFTLFHCEATEGITCLKNLPSCRHLLYFACSCFNDRIYALFMKYMKECNEEYNSGLNLDALPSSVAEWEENHLNGIEIHHNLGFNNNNYANTFYCINSKYNNINTFKDCINSE